MYLTLPNTLTLPFVDADRKGGNRDGGGLSARAWIVVAFVLAGILWQLVRLLVKG